MSPRSIRRAAERRQRKLLKKQNRATSWPDDEAAVLSEPKIQNGPARQLESQQSTAPPELPSILEPAHQVSEAKLAANRANAQLSTGPTSAEGKSKSSLNAVKTALTGRTVLLPTDDAEAYEQHLRAYDKEFKPMTPRETELVQSVADSSWRLHRIPTLELAIYARGRIQFADQFNQHEPALRPGLIELQAHLTYEKQLRNLHTQEARLHRRREKDLAELRQLQQERDRRERDELDVAAKLYTAAKHDKKPFHPADFGFDFSVNDVETYLEGVRAAHLLNASLKQESQRARSRANAV
jgi:hypothetical protein